MKKWFNCCASGARVNEDGNIDVASAIEIIAAEEMRDAKAQIREIFCRAFPDINIDVVIVDRISITQNIKIEEGNSVDVNTTIETTKAF